MLAGDKFGEQIGKTVRLSVRTSARTWWSSFLQKVFEEQGFDEARSDCVEFSLAGTQSWEVACMRSRRSVQEGLRCTNDVKHDALPNRSQPSTRCAVALPRQSALARS